MLIFKRKITKEILQKEYNLEIEYLEEVGIIEKKPEDKKASMEGYIYKISKKGRFIKRWFKLIHKDLLCNPI